MAAVRSTGLRQDAVRGSIMWERFACRERRQEKSMEPELGAQVRKPKKGVRFESVATCCS